MLYQFLIKLSMICFQTMRLRRKGSEAAATEQKSAEELEIVAVRFIDRYIGW